MKHHLFILGILAATTMLLSCSVDITISSDGESATVLSRSTIGSAMEKTIRAVGEIPTGVPLFDTVELSSQLKKQGITHISAQVQDLTGLSLKASIADISKGLIGIPECITVRTQNGTKYLDFTFSPDIVAHATYLLSETERAYLDLLMAPVLTGESLSSQDYLELVASVYGQVIADELASSRLQITMTSQKTGKKVQQSLSLLDVLLLTGDKQLRFSLPL